MEDVDNTLTLANLESATGPDGILYHIYKVMLDWEKKYFVLCLSVFLG